MATNTTATSQTHNGNGSTATFAISFSFLENTEVDVTVGGVLKTLGTHYNISGSSVTFTSGNIPPSGTGNIKFTRDTNISAKKVDFADGSVLRTPPTVTSTSVFSRKEKDIAKVAVLPFPLWVCEVAVVLVAIIKRNCY